MTIKPSALLPLVPYLRRHASLMAGSNEVADEHVHLCLEQVMADPRRLEVGDPRVELFRVFHAVSLVIETIDAQLTSIAGCHHDRIRGALRLLTRPERAALLLFVIEGFTLDETGRILNLEVEEVRRLLSSARRGLEALVVRSVLIIEDEPLLALNLNAVMMSMGFTSARLVVRMSDAIAAVLEERPDLVLADLELDDRGSGIEAAQAILRQAYVPIVFVTGYAERLMTEQGLEPAFVVTKPFREGHLKAVVREALSTYASRIGAECHRQKLLIKLDQLAA